MQIERLKFVMQVRKHAKVTFVAISIYERRGQRSAQQKFALFLLTYIALSAVFCLFSRGKAERKAAEFRPRCRCWWMAKPQNGAIKLELQLLEFNCTIKRPSAAPAFFCFYYHDGRHRSSRTRAILK